MNTTCILKAAFAFLMSLLFLDALEAQQSKYSTLLSPLDSLKIMRRPPISDMTKSKGRGVISELPEYDENDDSNWQVDIRSCDLTNIDLSERVDDLMYADFDSKTKWPKNLPESFNPDKIMELGMEPGLNVRELHKKGITGKKIGIAVIDQALLIEHIEYKNQLISYEEIHWTTSNPSAKMHASAIASIAVGKKVGVAPEADLYFIASPWGDYDEDGKFEYNLEYFGEAIERIIEINRVLPSESKIRVISMSYGLGPRMKNWDIAKKAIQKAEEENIAVLYSGSHHLLGMGRDPLKDPDDLNSYGAGLFWEKDAEKDSSRILVPMDSRCTASPTGESDYVFYRTGGMSWAEPYLAGLYALACQCDNNITFNEFWNHLDKTSIPIKKNGIIIGKAVNPLSIEELKK